MCERLWTQGFYEPFCYSEARNLGPGVMQRRFLSCPAPWSAAGLEKRGTKLKQKKRKVEQGSRGGGKKQQSWTEEEWKCGVCSGRKERLKCGLPQSERWKTHLAERYKGAVNLRLTALKKPALQLLCLCVHVTTLKNWKTGGRKKKADEGRIWPRDVNISF